MSDFQWIYAIAIVGFCGSFAILTAAALWFPSAVLRGLSQSSFESTMLLARMQQRVAEKVASKAKK